MVRLARRLYGSSNTVVSVDLDLQSTMTLLRRWPLGLQRPWFLPLQQQRLRQQRPLRPWPLPLAHQRLRQPRQQRPCPLLLLLLLLLCPSGRRQHRRLLLLPSVVASPELEE